MEQTKLAEILDKIMRRGDSAYNTCHGAFLEYLSSLASQLDLITFADACLCYVSAYPDSSASIAARVPGILCNRYFTVLPDFDYEKFYLWTVVTPNWGFMLQEGFTSSSLLNGAAASICVAVKAHDQPYP